MDPTKLKQLNDQLELLANQQKYNQLDKYFPDTGPYARSNYPVQMEFIRRSKDHHIMGLLGATGSGKSTFGAWFTYLHLSGKYPHWYNGHRYNQGPLNGWMASIETKQLRPIQEILFGSHADPGTGIIPKQDITDDKGEIQTRIMASTAHCYELCYIRHYNSAGKFDGWSKLEFKTYLQGWEQFQGATRQWIWLDEEPSDPKIFAECLGRLRGTEGKEGRILCTFTPLLGWSQVYLTFCPNGRIPRNGIHEDNPDKYTALIDDTQPHMSESWKRSMEAEWRKTDPLNVEARKRGIAAMGSGKVFPVEEEFFIIKRREIPDYFKRAYGLDFASSVGQTAAIWVAEDPSTRIKYVYTEYKRTGVHDSMHVSAIHAKGKWIPGICDPHSGRRDGGELRADYYKSLGLDLINGESNPVAGIAMILNDLQNGQLKIMEDCEMIINEIRTYRWDERHPGKVADKQDDHLLDSLRYLYSKFDYVSKTPIDDLDSDDNYYQSRNVNNSRDDLTGY